LLRDRKYVEKKIRRASGLYYTRYVKTPDLIVAKTLHEKRINVVGEFQTQIKSVKRYGKRLVFEFPKQLNLDSGYETALSLILGLRSLSMNRRLRKGRYYLEFDKLTAISPSMLLIVASEIDCLFLKGNYRQRNLVPADTDRWETHITALFNDFGIFELLNASPRARYTYGENLKAAKFIRGTTQDGGAALQLIENIVEISKKKPNQGERLYEGLGEALANALDHGHPNTYVSYPAERFRAWWAGAIYDESNETTHFMVYDRGIGLPASIPENHQKWFATIYDAIKGTETEDAELIWSAIQSPRSGTSLKHRGEGLKQMAEVVDNHPGSELQIFSGRGSVTYRGKNKKILNALPVEFPGTLVEWRIKHD